MSTKEIIEKVESLKEMEELLSEVSLEVETIKDVLKAEMNRLNVEMLEAGQYILRYTSVLSSRFDTKRFKEEIGADVYKEYCKETTSRRFTVS